MERNFVPEAWVGERVVVVRFDEQGASSPEQRGWLIGATDEGIIFSQESFPDALGGPMPEKAEVCPWDSLAFVRLLGGYDS